MENLKRNIRYQSLAAIVAIFVSVFQIFADPFGLASTTDRLSSLLFSALASPFYGQEVESDDKSSTDRVLKGRDEIVVLLFDDQYLNKQGFDWPLDPFIHLQWLQTIADAGASSIFVDINYVADSPERRQQLAAMVTAANDLWDEYGVPVYFAGMLAKPSAEYGGVTARQSALVEMYVEDYQYALQETAHDGSAYDTAAYALYKHWCESHSCGRLSESDEAKRMFVQWGYAPAGKMARYYEKTGIDCQVDSGNLLAATGQALRLFAVHTFNGFSGKWRPSCFYHTHASLQLPTQSPEELEPLVNGKIVMLGGALAQFPDQTESTVHGKVPGVFWHAAALDNLIEFGLDFLHEDQSQRSEINEALASALVLMLFTAFSLYIDYQLLGAERKNRHIDDRGQLAMNVHFGVAVVLLLSMSVSTLIYFSRSAPTNWIGIAALLFIVNPEPFKAIWKTSWFRLGRPNVAIFHRMANINILIRGFATALEFSIIWVAVIAVLLGPLVYFSLNPAAPVWGYMAMMLCYGVAATFELYQLRPSNIFSLSEPVKEETKASTDIKSSEPAV